ncbi:MAG: DEAD/DEAH box helicase [Oscillospiraceae bacterium]
MDFSSLNLTPPLLRAINDAGYTSPSPIQEQSIPPVIAGRDLLGCAQTGTGKTAAFALPILQLLADKKVQGKRPIRSLILTPTRELALQISESFEQYGKYLPLRTAVIFGGVGQAPQVKQLKSGVDVLVATPGRLNDLIGQGFISLSSLEIFVLDEADRMLDMGFVHDVKKVMALLPQKRQTLLFSATLPDEIVNLANSLLHNPARVFVTPISSTVESISQSLYKVDKTNKRHLLASLLSAPDISSALVFTRTKHGADRVVRELSRAKIEAMAIYGSKSQGARQTALGRFKEGKIKVLVATDIAARGLDISELSHVFNYDLPNMPETYVHRIGRTGRAGRGGIAISFCCVDELEYLVDIEKLIGFKIDEVTEHAWPMQVFTPTVKQQPGAQKPKVEEKAGGQKSARKSKNTPQKEALKEEKLSRKAVQKKPQGDKKVEKPANQVARQPKALSRREGAVAVASKAVEKPVANINKKERRPRPSAYDPYTNLTGGQAISTKRPVWSSEPSEQIQKGDADMSRNNNRRRGKSKNGNTQNKQPNEAAVKQPTAPVKAPPPPPTNEKGVFDFSENELAQDNSMRLITREKVEVKYATFEDYMKDH